MGERRDKTEKGGEHKRWGYGRGTRNPQNQAPPEGGGTQKPHNGQEKKVKKPKAQNTWVGKIAARKGKGRKKSGRGKVSR